LLRRVDASGGIGADLNSDNAVLQWFQNRADHAAARPVERRLEPAIDPARATYATSYEAWRRQFFGG
jgi:hypothetical protein